MSDEQPLWQIAVVEGIFVVAAAAILYFRNSAGAVVFRMPIFTEVAIGLLVGAVLGTAIGYGLLGSPLRLRVVQAVLPLRPVTASVWSIVIVSVLAALGEESLFRAALQTWIGLSWASVLFGLAHSGMARLNKGISAGKLAYLLGTVVAGILLGLLYRAAGLVASMSAHAAFDAGVLWALAPAIASAAGGPKEVRHA